jgi:hypothetical protein
MTSFIVLQNLFHFYLLLFILTVPETIKNWTNPLILSNDKL